MMKMNGAVVPDDTALLAGILDRLSILLWRQTVDGHNGVNPPELLMEKLLDRENDENNIQTFNTPEEFEAERKRRLGVK